MRKRQKNCCENGFKTLENGELRRCFDCNPPVFEFGLVMSPIEGTEDWTEGEIMDSFCMSLSEYFGAAINMLDEQEKQSRNLSF